MKNLFEQMIQRPMSAFLSSIELLMQPADNRRKADGLISRFIHNLSRPSAIIDSGDTTAMEESFRLSEENSFFSQEPLKTVSPPPAHLKKESFVHSRWQPAESANSSKTIASKDDDRVITNLEVRRNMSKDLRDDMLKLVRYKVLYVKREDERVLKEDDELVPDNLDSTAYTAWKIAELEKSGVLKGISDKDKKYLRVFYEVLDRYPRERFKYEEDQIEVLRQIRDKIPETQP